MSLGMPVDNGHKQLLSSTDKTSVHLLKLQPEQTTSHARDVQDVEPIVAGAFVRTVCLTRSPHLTSVGVSHSEGLHRLCYGWGVSVTTTISVCTSPYVGISSRARTFCDFWHRTSLNFYSRRLLYFHFTI